MEIETSDLNRYSAYVLKLVNEMGSLAFDPETILWHYTSGPGLLGMLTSNSIYSTQVSCLNDSKEVRFASELFRESLRNQESCFAGGSREGTFIKEALSYFDEGSGQLNHVRLPYFVTCFSEAKDDLSQWRAYGGGENGYALAFKAKHLFGVKECLLAKVIYYNDALHKTLADDVGKQSLAFFAEGISKYADQDVGAWTRSFLQRWDEIVTQAAPMIKDPGFNTEREYRLIKSYQATDLSELIFIQKTAMLARHLPLRPSPLGTDPYRLPITEIMIGPCRYPHVSRISIGTLLQQQGYNCPVTLTRSPYQAT